MAKNKITHEAMLNAAYRIDVPPGCEPAGPGALSVWVPGRPAPQGSKRYLGRAGGRGVMVESSKAVAPWRADIRSACEDAMEANLCAVPSTAEPVVVKLVFVMPRPVSLSKRKPTPPMTVAPDLDKLVRAVLDAIGSAGVWADDSQVVTVHAHKRRAEPGETTGCMIHIEPVAEPIPLYKIADQILVERDCDAHGRHSAGDHDGLRCLDCPECVPGESLPSAPTSTVE